MSSDIEKLRFPLGKFQKPKDYSSENLESWMQTIKNFPAEINHLLKSCSSKDLKKTYRPEGWSINQIVHHCADSHINAFIRFKLALTEDCPTIKPYKENLWAELPDTLDVDPFHSLHILQGVHLRWEVLLKSLNSVDFAKEYLHPQLGERFNLGQVLCMYDWHCRHHLAHIKLAMNS